MPSLPSGNPSESALKWRKRRRKTQAWWPSRREILPLTTNTPRPEKNKNHTASCWRPLVPLSGMSLVLFILYSYFSSLRSIIAVRWCSPSSWCVSMLCHDGVIMYFFMMILFHFWTTTFRSPGVVMKEANSNNVDGFWNPWKGQGGLLGCPARCQPLAERKRVALYAPLDDTTSTHCSTCQHQRPPRCHHCSVCQRCILQFDHHCVWVNQCIGYHNYRNFFLLLAYLSLGIGYGAILYFMPFLERLSKDIRHAGPMAYLFRSAFNIPLFILRSTASVPASSHGESLLRILYPVLLGVGAAVSGLWEFHIELVCTARTSLEEQLRAAKNPYDQGSYWANAVQVLGPWPYWFIPIPRDPPKPFLPQRR